MTKSSSPSESYRSRSPKQSRGANVRKLSKEKRERQQALEKLRIMVGGDEHSNQLEIVQNVIDYIAFLRSQLADDTENLSPNPADQLVHQLTSRFESVISS